MEARPPSGYRKKASPSPAASTAEERSACARGYLRVAGVDEAGRGPLAGPVVACAVVLRDFGCPQGVADSKTLSPSRRDALYESLIQSVDWAVGTASVAEIDNLNILNATHLAMRRAVEGLEPYPDFALVDGLRVKGLPVPHQAIVGGDATCISIAAASIIAKVTRDRLMLELERKYPAYGFARHKGYGTPQHLQALRENGPCPAHRMTFNPVMLSASSEAGGPNRAASPRVRPATLALGAEGERRAANALTTAGYTVLERNARIGHDELDLVCRHGDAWVFVEVKTRRGAGYGAPDEAVTASKQAKLIRAATVWLDEHGVVDPEWRFDVVAVRFQNGAPPAVEIIVNAFGDGW